VSLIPAGHVQIGSLLAVAQRDREYLVVTEIREVVRHGAYAPFTVSGSIVVNGVAASNYVALPAAFAAATYEQHHSWQHLAYAPYRYYCGWIVMFGGDCKNEQYDEMSGLSRAVTMWLPVLHTMEYVHENVVVSKWKGRAFYPESMNDFMYPVSFIASSLVRAANRTSKYRIATSCSTLLER
jgi:hypothetical protein